MGQEDETGSFEQEFEELASWPYALHAINDTLDVKLIEGRGKQLLFQGLSSKSIVCFVGSGVSQAYGHLGWREWLELQLGTVQDGAKAFIECAESLKAVLDAIKEDNRDASLKAFAKIKQDQIDYPLQQAMRLSNTLQEMRDSKGVAGGELTPITFQVAQQLRVLLDKALPVVLKCDRKSRSDDGENDRLLQLVPSEIKKRLDASRATVSDYIKASNEVGQRLQERLEALSAWSTGLTQQHDFATLAKVLLVDECSTASRIITRSFSTGAEFGRENATPIDARKAAERDHAEEAFSDRSLRRDIPGLARKPEHYQVLGYFTTSYFKGIAEGLSDLLRHENAGRLHGIWEDALKLILKSIEENNRDRDSGPRLPGRRFLVAPPHRFVFEVMAALVEKPLVEDGPFVKPAPVVESDFQSRLSITDRELDPLEKLVERLGVRQFLTLNYDFEIERYFQDTGYRRFSGQSTDPRHNRDEPGREEHRVDGLGGMVRDFSFSRERAADLISFSVDQDNADAAVYHLHGMADSTSRIVVTERDYMDLYLKRDENRTIVDDGIRMAFSSNPLFFVGLGMEEADILRPLRQFMSDRSRAASRTTIAFLPALDGQTKRVTDAASLFLRHGVHTIYFGDGYVRRSDGEGWAPIDWLYRVRTLVAVLLDINTAMLRRLQVALTDKQTDKSFLESRQGEAAKWKEKDDWELLGKYQSGDFKFISGRVGKCKVGDDRLDALAVLFGRDQIDLGVILNTEGLELSRCSFRSLRKPEVEKGEDELDASRLELDQDKGEEPYLKFEYGMLAALLRMTLRKPELADVAAINKADDGVLRENVRDLRARIVALEGLNNSILTGAFCAAADNLDREWRNWQDFWKVSPPHRRAEFAIDKSEGIKLDGEDAPNIPVRYIRNKVDNVHTRLPQADVVAKRSHLKIEDGKGKRKKDDEIPTTGVRSFDNFLEALQERTGQDARDRCLSLGRRMHLVIGERGVGKGTFMSAFETARGLGQYIASAWPDRSFSSDGERWEPPEYVASFFINLSFSTEIASTFDMTIDALAKVCAVLAHKLGSGSDLRSRLRRARQHLERLQFSDVAPGLGKTHRDKELREIKKIWGRDKDGYRELSRVNQLRHLIELFQQRGEMFAGETTPRQTVRFLLLFNATDLMYHEGGVAKNREIDEFVALLTGEKLSGCPFDLVFVSGNRTIGLPFVAAKRHAGKEDGQEVDHDSMQATVPGAPGGKDKWKLRFLTIVRRNIASSGIQNVRLRERRSGIWFIARTKPRPGKARGAMTLSLADMAQTNEKRRLQTHEVCTVHFARTVRSEHLLVENFPVLASILFAGHFGQVDESASKAFARIPKVLKRGWTWALKMPDARISARDKFRKQATRTSDGDTPDEGDRSITVDDRLRKLDARINTFAVKLAVGSAQASDEGRRLDAKATKKKSSPAWALESPIKRVADRELEEGKQFLSELLLLRYKQDRDSLDEWQNIRNILGANRFCLTILMAAAERVALMEQTIEAAKRRAEAVIRRIADRVGGAGVYRREDIVVSEVLDLYQSLHVAASPQFDMNLHRIIIRHLAVAGAPVSADVMVRMPEVRNYFDEHFLGRKERRTNLLVEALTELTRRGLIFRLYPQPAIVAHAERQKPDPDGRAARFEYRYALHRLVQRNVIRKLGAGPREFVEINSFAPTMYASMPADLPRLTPDSYRFLRTLVASLSQYPDNPGSDTSIENWHIGAASQVTRAEALRAALCVARSTFSVAVVSRFEENEPSDEAEHQRGHFETYRLQLRWFIRKAWHVSPPKNVKSFRAYRPEEQHETINALYRDEIVWLHNECGVTCLVQGNLNEAIALLRQALELTQKIEGPMGGGMQHNRIALNLAVAQIERGRIEPARRRLEAICQSEESAEKKEGRLWHLAHGYLGLISHIAGDVETARRHYKKAIAALRIYDDSRGCSVFSRHLGDLERMVRNYNEARVLLDEAINLAQGGGHEDMRRKAMLSLIRLEIAESVGKPRFNSAGFNVQLTAISDYAAAMEMPVLTCEALFVRANLLVADGETRLAGVLLAEAMTLAKRNGMRLRLNGALTNYARVLAMRDQKDQARRLLATSLDMAKRQKNQLELRRVENAMASLQSEPTRLAEVADVFR